jgi:c-di-GMP-binding flagellar brake protein YcgR
MDDSTFAKERRREQRIAQENKLTFELMSDINSESYKGICHALTKDLSLSGMRLTSSTFLPVNSPLKINLSLPETQKLVKLFGVTRWVKTIYEDERYDCGLEFTDIAPESSMALIEHLFANRSH